MKWILIILWGSGMAAHPKAIDHIEFSSEEACLAAAEKLTPSVHAAICVGREK